MTFKYDEEVLGMNEDIDLSQAPEDEDSKEDPIFPFDMDKYDDMITSNMFFPMYEKHRIIIVEDNFLYDYQTPMAVQIFNTLVINIEDMRFKQLLIFLRNKFVGLIYAYTNDYSIKQVLDTITLLVKKFMVERIDIFNKNDELIILSEIEKLKLKILKNNSLILKYETINENKINIGIILNLLERGYDIHLFFNSTDYNTDDMKKNIKKIFKKYPNIKYKTVDKESNIKLEMCNIRKEIKSIDETLCIDMLFTDSPKTILDLTNSNAEEIKKLIRIIFIPSYEKIALSFQLTNSKAMEIIDYNLKVSGITILPLIKKIDSDIVKKASK